MIFTYTNLVRHTLTAKKYIRAAMALCLVLPYITLTTLGAFPVHDFLGWHKNSLSGYLTIPGWWGSPVICFWENIRFWLDQDYESWIRLLINFDTENAFAIPKNQMFMCHQVVIYDINVCVLYGWFCRRCYMDSKSELHLLLAYITPLIEGSRNLMIPIF